MMNMETEKADINVRILGNKKLAACTCTLQVFYTSIIIGKIIGRRFVFFYNRGAIVSMISFLISDHLLVFLSMIFSWWAATAFWASLFKSSDFRIYTKSTEII